MKITADTNTFLAVTLFEPERGELIRLTDGADLVAPEVLPFEIGNAISAMFKRGRLASEDILVLWDAIQQIPVDLRSIDVKEALTLASNFNIYAYDAYFIACALSLRTPLLTLDRRMMAIARKLDIQTIEVGA